MSKKIQIIWVFLALFLFTSHLPANAETKENLLNSKEQAQLKTADMMTLVDIISMYETPHGVFS